MTTITPNMNLIIPGVGTEPGPDFATDINNSLTLIDQHNHSLGSGVQITPDGININASLSMGGQSLTNISALTLTPQGSDAVSNSLYEKGVDLYFRDGSGNVIRITQSGSVSGASGTITGLPSGTASASYSGGTFTFQSATNTGANVDAASIILRNATASSKGLTLQPPNAMAADYSLTLPSIPSFKSVLALDTAGNMVTSSTTDFSSAAITNVNSNSTTYQLLASVTITVSGTRPVQVGLISTPSSSLVGLIGVTTAPSTGGNCIIRMDRDGTTISTTGVFGTSSTGGGPAISVPPASATFLDITPTAGSHTYEVYSRTNIGGGAVFYSISNCTLVAFEI